MTAVLFLLADQAQTCYTYCINLYKLHVKSYYATKNKNT